MKQENLLPRFRMEKNAISGELVVTERTENKVQKTQLPFESELPSDYTLPKEEDVPAVPRGISPDLPSQEQENNFFEERPTEEGFSDLEDNNDSVLNPAQVGGGRQPRGRQPMQPPRRRQPMPPHNWQPLPPHHRRRYPPRYPTYIPFPIPSPPIIERPPIAPPEGQRAILLSAQLHEELKTLEHDYKMLQQKTNVLTEILTIKQLESQTQELVYSSARIYQTLTGRRPPTYYPKSNLPRNFVVAVDSIDAFIIQIKNPIFLLL